MMTSGLTTVVELAAMAGITRYQMKRVLRTHGVPLRRMGGALAVSPHDVQSRVPFLWRSIVVLAQVRGSTTR